MTAFFFDMSAITSNTHRSPRTGRQHERYAHVCLRALDARNEAHVAPMGGGSSPAPAHAPRRMRTTSRKPASGDGDSDSDGDGPVRRRVQPLFYDLPDVAHALSLSTRGVQRLVQEGSFPKPRAMSARRVAWLVSDVEQWAISRPTADILPPANAGCRP
ncbi:AlpA family phage regulatory protein [Paraburkholderia sediminicola]|uniref:helix-turn-helix transcriptional regulator n=1 Tax=Paraburkholderia TaxID=1822464 RepID=UPI0038BB36F6